MKFKKDGYDYVSENGKFEITNEYGCWVVYYNNKKLPEYFNKPSDAKKYADEYSKQICDR